MNGVEEVTLYPYKRRKTEDPNLTQNVTFSTRTPTIEWKLPLMLVP